MKKLGFLALLVAGVLALGGCGKTCHDCCGTCGYCEACPSGCYDADGECND